MNSLIKLSSILVVSAAATLSACGVTDSMSKTAVGQDAINGIDVNDDKADSMKQPTSKGAIAVDAPVDGSFTTHTAFHAYTYAFTGAAGTLQSMPLASPARTPRSSRTRRSAIAGPSSPSTTTAPMKP